MTLRRALAAAAALSLLCAGGAGAQFASTWSWGATAPMFTVSLEDSVSDRTEFLSAGAGMFFAANLAPTQDGRWRMVTFAVPVFFNYADGFSFSPGFTIGTLNNLLSVGVTTKLIDQGKVVKDVFSRETTFLLLSASLNFGSGSGGTEAQVSKAAAAGTYGRPPGYVSW